MAEKKKILYVVEAMGGGVFTYIVELAKQLQYKIMLQSNGRAFAKADFAEHLDAYRGLINFCIALHGPNAEIHDRITQRSGSYAETIQGLQNIHKMGFHFGGKIVISRQNFQVLLAIAEKFALLHASSVDIAFPHAQGRASKMWEQVVPRYKEISSQVKQAAQYLLNKKIAALFETINDDRYAGFYDLPANIRRCLYLLRQESCCRRHRLYRYSKLPIRDLNKR